MRSKRKFGRRNLKYRRLKGKFGMQEVQKGNSKLNQIT